MQIKKTFGWSSQSHCNFNMCNNLKDFQTEQRPSSTSNAVMIFISVIHYILYNYRNSDHHHQLKYLLKLICVSIDYIKQTWTWQVKYENWYAIMKWCVNIIFTSSRAWMETNYIWHIKFTNSWLLNYIAPHVHAFNICTCLCPMYDTIGVSQLFCVNRKAYISHL